MPSLSIVICNYNDSRFLISSVEAFYKQMDDNDELIIVDDNSTDTDHILLNRLREIYRIKVVLNDGEKGPFGTFVKGCTVAKHEFISCWSADDYPQANYISMMKVTMDQFPIVDIYTCNASVLREDSMYSRILFPFTSYIAPDYAVKIFKNGYAKKINLVGMVMKKELVLRCWEQGGSKTKVNFDALFAFLSIFEKGFINIGVELALYRSYPNSYGASGKGKLIKDAVKVHKKVFALYPEVNERMLESGILDDRTILTAQIALIIIPRLPKFIRKAFYRWFYSYDNRIEKL